MRLNPLQPTTISWRHNAGRWLDWAAIGTVVIAVATVAIIAFWPPAGKAASASLVGTNVATEAGLTSTMGRPMLVVVYTKTCRYCVDSLPALRGVLAALSRFEQKLSRVAITFDSRDEFETHLEQQRLHEFDLTHVIPAGGVLTTVTPRVLWVDDSGVVTHDWLGLVDTSVAAEITGVVTSALDKGK